MWLFEKKQKEDHVKEWLETLQVKFALNERESKKLFEVTRTCFAHNLDEEKVKRVNTCRNLRTKYLDFSCFQSQKIRIKSDI